MIFNEFGLSGKGRMSSDRCEKNRAGVGWGGGAKGKELFLHTFVLVFPFPSSISTFHDFPLFVSHLGLREQTSSLLMKCLYEVVRLTVGTHDIYKVQ